MTGDARRRILIRVERALAGRPGTPHPGAAPAPAPRAGSPVERFAESFQATGGEVVRLADREAARAWLAGFSRGFAAAAVGAGVPAILRPELPSAPPEQAPLGVSLARSAAADTGTLLLTSLEGRRLQLLPPVHLVWVPEVAVVAALSEALEALGGELPAALGLHSGPSKSADIGQILVTGVHGPGRVLAALVGGRSDP